MRTKPSRAPLRILVLDLGGTHVKIYPPGGSPRVQLVSGPSMTPVRLTRELRKRLEGVQYDVVAMGYPGLVAHGTIVREPSHLAKGWVGFDFERALGHPIQIVNDAALQALGSYVGGRMLFLGLGTGLGSAMIIAGELQPMELAHLPWKKGRTYEDFVGEPALRSRGRKKWQKEVFAVVAALAAALEPDYVVLGGGNVRKLKELPPGVRAGSNRNAFTGGLRLWRGGGRAVETQRAAAASRTASGRRSSLKDRGPPAEGPGRPPGPGTKK
ncbi:MAG: ROK family protein [Thermoplasmata archaeon]